MTRVRSLIAAAVFLSAFAFYTRNAAPSVTAGDSGEFITAAATLSLPHSPSFPLYVISARCFVSVVPFGSTAYRCNVFSAATSALTLVVLLLIAWQCGVGSLAGTALVLLLGFSGSFWENSLVTEVFALNTLLAALVTLTLLKVSECRRSLAWLAVFLMGLGAGNHQVLAFVGPVFAVVVWRERQWIFDRVVLVGAVAAFVVGFSIYLVLPIRAQANPPLNWGNPTTPAKLAHTILRKDYGTLTLALGEKPDRSLNNSVRHFSFFVNRMAHEVTWPVLALGVIALMWGAWRRDRFAWMALVGFVFTGPFFIWLGNLPLTPQSEGIIGRFLILPAFFLVAGLIPVLRQFKSAAVIATAFAFVEMNAGWTLAADHRSGLLVLDYGRAMMRSLPVNAALFMDGGDDAFYSLAMLQNVMGKRPDVELHDRGGLVFPNPYGDDFRALPRDHKPARRQSVEKQILAQRPVYYVTMDPDVLPGVNTVLNGLLVQTTPMTQSLWPFYVFRSVYPPQPQTYRMRALAAFFPYAYARALQSTGDTPGALAAYARSLEIGRGVDWLQSNLSYEFAQWGYHELISNRLEPAEAIYRQWIAFEPTNMQPQSNMGVVLERLNRLDEARAQYERTAVLFPKAADPVFNLSVLAWKRGDWAEVVRDLEEVLRRNPQHPQASAYLITARQKLNGASR